ncbi:MAG TPA: rhomboid family intramembrane serine protease [Planctomycetota bacterium]|nr:rhomboid family intramembrane serine protease [Planctomycetota bacterium]
MRRGNETLGSVAPFTVVVLVANVALYAVCAVYSKNIMDISSPVLSGLGASQRELLWEGEWVRLIAPMFLHVGAWHIGMNMFFLWRVGPAAEVYFGTANYGTIYLLSGATGICLSQIFGGNTAVGASGSLCGIMGAHLAVSALNCPVPKNAWRNSQVRAEVYNILILLGIGILGIFRMDNWGHFGGLVAGVLLGACFELWRRRKRIGQLGLVASLLAIGGLICAARWSVFNPEYHLYMMAYAKEELKDDATAEEHRAEAKKWGSIWTPLHFLGVLNATETENLLQAYDYRSWNLPKARRYLILRICNYYRSGRNVAIPAPDPE